MKLNKLFKVSCVALACSAAVAAPTFAAETKYKPGSGVKFDIDGNEFSIGGRLMVDWDSFDGVHNGDESGSDSEFRRARMYIKGKIAKDWEAKLQMNYNDAKKESNLEDAYVKFKGWDIADLTIGQRREPFGLEAQTSSNDITAIERTMTTQAFDPGRSRGLTLNNATKNFHWAVGLYDSELKDEDGDIDYAYTGRVVFAPINTKDSVVHFGGAFTHRDLENNTFRINERAEVHTADKIVSSATLDADDVTIYGLEAATVMGSLHAQAEYFTADVGGANNGPDADYDGYYAQVGYILTGETRPYDIKKGAFKRVKPGNDGAWEVFYRFSNLNAEDNGAGVEAENHTIGLNYYVNNAIRVGVNYISTELEGPGATALAADDGDALTFRFQFVF